MPEGLEIELYRRAAEASLDREIAAVRIPVAAFVRNGPARGVRDALVGRRFGEARRVGKLLLLDTADTEGVTLGLRFGMTGRLIVDDDAVIERLEYSSGRNDAAWDRLIVDFVDGGSLRVRDQRRLGSAELDPDDGQLGVDLFAVTGADLKRVLGSSSRPLKARLMDQSQIAGLGNLLTDEILWRASLAPERAADGLDAAERRRLLHHLRRTVALLLQRGGSHMGDLQDERHPDGRCPRDGAPLRRCTVGGRTTYACTDHQRARD
ncbi:MAG: DNA-formamidopyrimidine glycosylase family protein [Actinomycetota bacterium]